MSCRTRALPHSRSRKSRAWRRSSSCSSLKPKFTSPPPGQAEHALGEDVAQHLAGPALDAVGPRAQVAVRPPAAPGRPLLTLGEGAVGAQPVESGLGDALVELAPHQLVHRSLRPGLPPL